MTRARIQSRPGFTLVELLVVVALIIVLLGLVLAVNSSGITDSYKSTGAADRVSGWLLIAKSKAQRDQKPAGVRFVVGPTGLIKEAQYIEVPDSYVPLPNSTTPTTPPKLLISMVAGANPTPRVFFTDTNFADLINSVGAGDMLTIPEFRSLHTVMGFGTPQPLTLANGTVVQALEISLRNPVVLRQALGANFPTTAGPAPTPTYATTTFGFHRQAQPTIGEPGLQLTSDMAVDPLLCLPATANAANTSFDVLFAPTGEVMNAPAGKTILWIRDTRLPTPRPNGTAGPDNRTDYEASGQMGLVVVYSKTGAIATQPVILPAGSGVVGHNPFGAANDAVNTGL